jgi:hypothetical protein
VPAIVDIDDLAIDDLHDDDTIISKILPLLDIRDAHCDTRITTAIATTAIAAAVAPMGVHATRLVGRCTEQLDSPGGAVTSGQQLVAYAVRTGRLRDSAEHEQCKNETNTHDLLLGLPESWNPFLRRCHEASLPADLAENCTATKQATEVKLIRRWHGEHS